MIKKVIAAFALAMSIGSAFAAVDVNTANTDALRGIKGIGPAKAKAILDERDAHGPFKDAADLEQAREGHGRQDGRTPAGGRSPSVGPASKTARGGARGVERGHGYRGGPACHREEIGGVRRMLPTRRSVACAAFHRRSELDDLASAAVPID